jgi:3-oxoadipate enol-lactonase
MTHRVLELARPWGTLTGVGAGSGPTVVLLHPLAQAAEMWRPIVDELVDDFQVVALDARGHGRSGWDGSPFSVEDMADDVGDLLGQLDLGPSALVGMSMGGCVAMTVAARYPELVSRLVLVDTTADYGPGKSEAWAQRAIRAVEVPRVDQLPFQVDRWFSPSFVESNPDEVARVNAVFCATSSQAHAQACRALGAFEFTAELAHVTAPTMIAVGEDDVAATVAMSEDLQRGIAGSCLHVLPKTRHLSLIENRDSWALLKTHLVADGRTCPTPSLVGSRQQPAAK